MRALDHDNNQLLLITIAIVENFCAVQFFAVIAIVTNPRKLPPHACTVQLCLHGAMQELACKLALTMHCMNTLMTAVQRKLDPTDFFHYSQLYCIICQHKGRSSRKYCENTLQLSLSIFENILMVAKYSACMSQPYLPTPAPGHYVHHAVRGVYSYIVICKASLHVVILSCMPAIAC